MKYLLIVFFSLTCQAETDYNYVFSKTGEAAYKYFKLEEQLKPLEERFIPKWLNKYTGFVSIGKALIERKIDYTFTF